MSILENNLFKLFKAQVPEQKIGDWEVIKYEIDELNAKMFNLGKLQQSYLMIEPGRYTKLINRKQKHLWMSDTRFETQTMIPFYHAAYGHVLITGLGLGIIAHAIAKKVDVESVTVIEKAPTVIKLVAPHIKHPKLTVRRGSAFTVPRGVHYDYVYHDIWPTIAKENVRDMWKLRSIWRPYTDNQMYWGFNEIKFEIRRYRQLIRRLRKMRDEIRS